MCFSGWVDGCFCCLWFCGGLGFLGYCWLFKFGLFVMIGYFAVWLFRAVGDYWCY